MTRMVLDSRAAARIPVSLANRRRAEQRARRWVLRELDRLDEQRREPKTEPR
jgi:hypothetical protein